MDLTTFQSRITQLIEAIKNDSSIPEEVRSSLEDMIMQVSSDPTPENMEALAIVLNKASQTQKYMGSMTELQNLQLDSAMGL